MSNITIPVEEDAEEYYYHFVKIDVLSYMPVFALSCLVLTVFFARRFFLRDFDGRSLSQSLEKKLAVALCALEMMHSLATSIVWLVAPKDLTLVSQAKAHWSLKIAFLATTGVIFFCQSYLSFVIYKVSNRKKWLFGIIYFVVVAGLLVSIGAILFGQMAITDQRLESYISLVILPWRVFSDAGIYFVLMHYFSTRMVDRNKRVGLVAAKLIALAWLCVQLTTLSPNILTLIPGVNINYVSLIRFASHELIGNLYPYILMTLFCTPGFIDLLEEEFIPLK